MERFERFAGPRRWPTSELLAERLIDATVLVLALALVSTAVVAGMVSVGVAAAPELPVR